MASNMIVLVGTSGGTSRGTSGGKEIMGNIYLHIMVEKVFLLDSETQTIILGHWANNPSKI